MCRLRWLAFMGLLALAGCATAPSTFDAAPWLADFAQLQRAMETSYSHLAWKASTSSDVNLPRLARDARAALASAASDAEARQALRRFVKELNDGHFSELTFEQPRAPELSEPPAAALDKDDPASGCAALGYAATSPVAFSLPFETLPGFRLLADGLSRPFRAGLVGAGTGVLRIENFAPRAFPAACLRAWPAAGQPQAHAVRDAVEAQWLLALAERLDELRAAGARRLILDIGNNSGGNDSGDWLARYFTDRLVRSARLLMVDGPPAVAYAAEQMQSLADARDRHPGAKAEAALEAASRFFAAAPAQVGRQPCDLSWVWHEQRPWGQGCRRLVDMGFAGGASAGLERGAFGNPAVAAELSGPSKVERYFGRWTGPAWVLINGRSYSSAEMFAAVMRDQGIARLMGSATGGDGCGFMVEMPPIVLANSKLRFRSPNCVRLRADGTDEVAGVAPNDVLLPAAGESPRQLAARAVLLAEEGFAR